MTLPLPNIAVMLCTHNGERFLQKQVESLARQTVGPLLVYVSDDGSTDQTLAIIERSKITFPQLQFKILIGPQQGFAQNFLSIFKMDTPPAKYIAYADQDDIWEADKLECALKFLQTLPIGQPGLYGGRTQLIDEDDREIGLSPLFTKAPSFSNALVQNIFGGNTMVMNIPAWQIMKATLTQKVATHDWWTYLVIAGVDGKIFYDPTPKVRYRQHAGNIIGANSSLLARFARLKMLLQGRYTEFNEANVSALLPVKQMLTAENQEKLEEFAKARKANLPARLRYLISNKVYRQTFFGMIGLWLAVLLGKF